ncbi:MAG: hypothetical protein ACI87L_002092, partial [Litorivivens sp.]
MAGSQQLSPQLKESLVNTETASPTKVPWNKGKIVGQ